MASPTFFCANWSPQSIDCANQGKRVCTACRLVAYCGPKCQNAHLSTHKKDCNSPLLSEAWKPGWVRQNRKPVFSGKIFGVEKFLWGNMPAIDILRLEANEGKDYSGDLRLLFAASGDLRNVIKTVLGLPEAYSRPLSITINDVDFDVAARNTIMMMIALTVEPVEKAIDCIIHVWYSTFVRQSDIEILQSYVRPMIEEMCEKIKSKRLGAYSKTWKLDRGTLRVGMEKSSWDRFLSLLSKPLKVSVDLARTIRKKTMLAASRVDYRERTMCALSPLRRAAFAKFQEDGLLVPFGYPRHEFKKPNPTFFQNADRWPMQDSAEPLQGWPAEEVEDTSSGLASADIYGKLFYYLRSQLKAFLGRLSGLEASFTVHQFNVTELPKYIGSEKFCRIEVSNIMDEKWVKVGGTLGPMMPLLQTPNENPHATLLGLFMMAVDDTRTAEERSQPPIGTTVELMKLYVPALAEGEITSLYDPSLIKVELSRGLVETHDEIFDHYQRKWEFRREERRSGAMMKDKNTIIDKWPYKLKLNPNNPAGRAEFARRIGAGLTGKEIYAEWKRVPPHK